MGGSVTAIKTSEEFNKIINGDKPVVIDFWAEWCGPCKMMSPVFEKISSGNDHFNFYSVDVEALGDVMNQEQIAALPTFIVYHKGGRVKQMKGAVPATLTNIITEATALTSG